MADEQDPILARALANRKAQTQGRVIDSLDADPEKAATASKLGNDTGADPNVIYHNFDDVMREHQKALTNGIIENSPPLQEYVNSHPLAAKVSKDDWGNLSKLMDVLGSTPLTRPLAQLGKSPAGRDIVSSLSGEMPGVGPIVSGTIERAKEGFGQEPVGYRDPWIEALHLTPEAEAQFKETRWMTPGKPYFFQRPTDLATLWSLYEFVTRASVGGAAGGIAGFLGSTLVELGMEPATAASGMRDVHAVSEIVLQLLLGGLGPKGARRATMGVSGALESPALRGKHPELLELEKETGLKTKADYKVLQEWNKLGDSVERALPYIKEGEEPPVRLDPDIDKMIMDDSKEGLKELKEQEKAANKTVTKERDRDMLELAISKATKGQNVGLEWDGVKALYGDKLPEPGDGLLGDIPGVAEKFQASMTSGEDITVPKSQWLSKVEKEVSEKLDGFVKHRPGALSEREIESLGKAEEIPPIEPGVSNWQNVVDGVRRAAGLEPLLKKLPKAREPTQLELGVTRQEDIPLFKPGALMPKRMYDQYFNQMNKIFDADKEKDLRVAEREERRRQMPEWTENYKKEQEKVVEDIKNSRPFRFSDFFRNGILNGEDVGVKPRIRTDSLTPEQRAAIPAKFQAKNGIDPDLIARALDYQTGSEMINDIIAFEETRKEAGDKPGEFFNRLVKRETDRRMEVKYGKFEENVAAAAREHVISPTAFDLVHQEVMALAMRAGQKMPMSKDDLRQQAYIRFTDSIASEQDLSKYVGLLGKAGRAAEEAWLKGDVVEAFKQKQLQAQHMAVAALAKEFQKEQRAWDRGKKAHSGEEDKSLPQEYQNWLHDLYYRVGETTKRSLDTVKQSIQDHEHKTFQEFADKKNMNGLPVGAGEYGEAYTPKIPITPFLYDQPFNKTMDKVTVGEFRAINNTAQALIKLGRGEKQVLVGDKLTMFEEAKKELLDWVNQTHPDKPFIHNPTAWQKRRKQLATMRVGLMQLEHFFRMVDAEDPRGIASRSLIYPLMEAGNKVDTTGRMYAKILQTLDKFTTDFEKPVPNTVFHDPSTFDKDPKTGRRSLKQGTPLYLEMNRENMLAVAMNWGNKSNRDVLVRGHLVSEADVQGWLDTHMTKQDWQLVKSLGDIMAKLQKAEDRMTMDTNNSVLDKLILGKVQTKLGDKLVEMDGWYWPVKYHPDFTKGNAAEGILGDKPFFRVQTEHGWTNARTGYAAPLDLHMSNVGDIIARRIRHTGLSPAIAQVSKLMLDGDFMEAINRKFGSHYSGLFEKYLKDIAGQGGYTSPAANVGNRLGQHILANTVSTLVGYNPGTIIKHSLTAFGQSWREVGTGPFLKAMIDLYRTSKVVQDSNDKFITEGGQVGTLDWKGSDEINRRPQHWLQTLGGASEMLFHPSKLEAARRRGMERRTWMLATIDQWISKVTWLAKYRTINEENLGPKGMSVEEAHLDAVRMADRAVRNTHGSTMVAARPEFMRSNNAMVQSLTSLGLFYNHILNRWLTMGPRGVRAYGKWKRGEPVAEDVKDLTKDVLMYVVFPSVVHEIMDPTCSSEEWNKSWGTCTGMTLGVAGLSPIFLARDMAHAAVTGHDPGLGMFGSAAKPVTDMLKDMQHIGDKRYLGRQVEDANALLGVSKGLASRQVGRWEKYFINTMLAQDHLPRGPGEAMRVLRFGVTKERKHR
jgi:hypothetical protein